MEDIHLDECVSCGAGLLAVSDICPQCGCSKNMKIESVVEEIKEIEIESPAEHIVSEIKIVHRPSGVRLLGFFLMVFGVLLVISSIVFGSATLMPVLVGGVGTVDGISGIVIDLHVITGLSNAGEIQGLSNPLGNFEGVMQTMMESFGISIAELVLGIYAFVIGRGLFKGRKWAWILTIMTSIISIPIIVLFVGKLENFIIFGTVVFDILLLCYMFRPYVRVYFNQPPIKKAKKSKSKNPKIN